MSLVSVLKDILNSDSDSLVELEKLFLVKYPKEVAMHNLISGYVYSESVYKVSEQSLVTEIQNWFERRV